MKSTPLAKIQKQIDKCNGKSGCNSRCSKRDQEFCRLLKSHTTRIDECRENKLPIIYW
jgi:hypothetical protein